MTALFITLFLPLFGAILLLFLGNNAKVIKNTALGISVITFIVSLFLYFSFDQTNPDFQFVYEYIMVSRFDAGFRIGLDGMSILLVMLTTFISPIAILSSFETIKKRDKEYYFLILILQFAMTGVFVALDLFLFYMFWELILIPMYFIIGLWGGKNRIYAAVKFFIFTAVGSLFMLVAIVWVAYYVGTVVLHLPGGFTSNYFVLKEYTKLIPANIQGWLFWAFALSFFIKVPLFPVHTWLPDAHTEAPTPGSVILASILLKMGTYGLIRFNLELFPNTSIEYASIISSLAVIGIIYGALVAMMQTDFKKLIAYTSVSHLGFVVLGIFSMTLNGVQGAIIQMINHGLSTGLLFLCVGFLYERRHTRLIADYGGIAKVMPKFSVVFGIAMFASIGLPGLNGFVGEFLTLIGAFESKILNNHWFTIFATTGVIWAACYLLWMYQRVMYGTNDNPLNHNLKDLKLSEYIMTVPLIIFIVWIGIYPHTFLKVSDLSAKQTVNKIDMIKFNRQTYELPTLNKNIENKDLENNTK